MDDVDSSVGELHLEQWIDIHQVCPHSEALLRLSSLITAPTAAQGIASQGLPPRSTNLGNEVDDFSQKRFAFIRYAAFNVYRRLFSLAFTGNAIAFIVLMVKGASPLDLVNALAVNLAVCGLCRHPLVVNSLFLIHGFILALLLAIIVVAHPVFRAKRHGCFELTHRFANWAVLVIFWVLVFLPGSQEPSLSTFLLHLPAFWILMLLTLAKMLPWLLLRRVPVTAEPLSPHATRLHFSYTTHSFASVTDRLDSPVTNFSCLVSGAGDWTRQAIAEPPKYPWKRGLPTYGFGYVFRMFERNVVVTSGSRIGLCLSPLTMYGRQTLDLIRRVDGEPVVIDTSVLGRLDMLPIMSSLYREFGADAVCVVSKPQLTKRLVNAL
ncbi:hypothetical protein N657DRAFT_660972 [Parathielavia appendiculata]|uniref:Uncharacterized protein n=1 Tax=Parathielavia appendiculata TaxID=2587402 RepID=A0AAN6Z9L7_9PEZI|nr:hypothetical protein N657DRAFT_660972 [Parathielavia appendiculata]